MSSIAPGSPIELCLFAPYNDEVALISSWNNWTREAMTRGSDGWWRISPRLPDGDHLYKFAVKSKSYFAMDQWRDVFDPYALAVTNDDQQRSHLCVQNGKRRWIDYTWRCDDCPLPTNDQLIIYELHVGDFTGGKGDIASPRVTGKFTGVIEKLDYLKDLGINAVELMPVKESPGSWGYSLRSLFAIESSYGSPAELCQLVDECHARKIRVIMDCVYNHADADAPLAQIDYQYWFYRQNPDPPEMQWGPKYNYNHYDEKLKIYPARKYVIDSILFWMQHLHIDGIRFDATRAIKDFAILREFTDAAFKMVVGRKPFFTVSEHVPEDPNIVGYPDRGPMIATWHESFAKQLQAIATRHERDGADPSDLDALEQKMNPATNGFITGNHVVNYIGSHDQDRILKQLADYAALFGEAAFRRVKLATALLLTCPGLPMIWMGQEFGAANPKSADPQPIEWALLANKDNKDLHQYTKRLIKLRCTTPALCGDAFEVVLKDQQQELFAYKRWNNAGAVIIVVANLKDSPVHEFDIANAGLEDGDWHEFVFDYDHKIVDGLLKDALGPSEVKIYIKL